jgi:hypothetical protein
VRLPSFSIAEVMVIVAIVALDCLATRVRVSPATLPCLICGALPMQCVLVIGLLLLFRQRRLRRKPSPFLVGFEVVGWIGLLVYVAVCFQAPRSLDQHLSSTLSPVVSAIGFQRFSTLDYICQYGAASSYLTAPQLAIALVAGWISHWWTRKTHPERVPTHE